MKKYTPIGLLPGNFVGCFEDKVMCMWKDYPEYALLFFFEASPNPGKKGGFRDLLCLRFENMFSDISFAKQAARESWSNHKKRILAGNGDRVYVTEIKR